VEIEEGVDALIHVSDLSWSKNVRHASEVLKKGQKVEGVILSLDVAARRVSMGIKQMQPDIWQDFFSTTKVGDILHGKVVRMPQFGAFVELREGIEGLCHISEMDEQHTGKGPDRVQAGKEYDFRVVRLNPAEKRVGLSLKSVEARSEPAPATEPAPKASSKPEPSLSPFAAAMRAALSSRTAAATRVETSAAKGGLSAKAETPEPAVAPASAEKTVSSVLEAPPPAETAALEPPLPLATAGLPARATSTGGKSWVEGKPESSGSDEAVPLTSSAAENSLAPAEPAGTKAEESEGIASPPLVEVASAHLSSARTNSEWRASNPSSSPEPEARVADQPRSTEPTAETQPATQTSTEENSHARSQS
jgi:predicted RNA-binding protein with RPS1 domain